MNRRHFLLTSTAVLCAPRPARAKGSDFEIRRSDAEWRDLLSPAEYEILREEGTEPPDSSSLNDEARVGTYHCRGCDLPLYRSDSKYDSGTGWPSFHSALPGAIGTREDRSFIFQVRTEVHCRRCGSHLGHVFDDGPEPTGKRHCLNGLALAFRPS
jgi:peptide-methionine (R)-S-oxide reductase